MGGVGGFGEVRQHVLVAVSQGSIWLKRRAPMHQTAEAAYVLAWQSLIGDSVLCPSLRGSCTHIMQMLGPQST